MIRPLACLAAIVLLAGCGDDTPEPPSPRAAAAPLAWDYLPKLGLDVSEITVEDSWTPQGGSGEHVEDQASIRPADALTRMVHDRLAATGGSGRAVAIIEDASLVRVSGQLVGSFAVQIVLESGATGPSSPVVASVSGTRTLSSDDGEQATADALVRQLMDRMNVELEYQVRHQLADHLGGAASPVATPVQSEDLAPPQGSSAGAPGVTPPAP